MAFDVMRGFNVGQQMAGGNALGTFAKGLLDRVNAVGEASLKSQMDVQSQAALLPMKEASAARLMERKAQLFPPQPRALSGDAAGRLSLSTMGERHAKNAKRLLFPQGTPESFDWAAAGASRHGLTRWLGGYKPQSLEFNVKRAIDAQLRAETGATAPEPELNRMTQEFISNAFADPTHAFDVISTLEEGLRRTRTAIDPTGYYSSLGASPFEPTQEDVSSLSDEDILQQLELQ